MERVPMTKAGYEKVQADLKRMKGRDRLEVADEIEIARAHGDLRENADYEAAKEKQGMLEAHIRMLDDQLARADVIDVTALSGERVLFGATVQLLDLDTDEELTLTIVGEVETNIDIGRISVTSPIGRTLIGKNLDDTVIVNTPGGRKRYEITDVQFNG